MVQVISDYYLSTFPAILSPWMAGIVTLMDYRIIQTLNNAFLLVYINNIH